MYAAQHGSTETCRLLLASNADVNARNKYQMTALMLAAEYGRTGTCHALTGVPRCFIGATDEKGQTAADLCCIGFRQAPNPDLKRFLTTAIENETQQIHEVLGAATRSALHRFNLPADLENAILTFAFGTITNEHGIALKQMIAEQEREREREREVADVGCEEKEVGAPSSSTSSSSSSSASSSASRYNLRKRKST